LKEKEESRSKDRKKENMGKEDGRKVSGEVGKKEETVEFLCKI
jgi:hypothetical protein